MMNWFLLNNQSLVLLLRHHICAISVSFIIREISFIWVTSTVNALNWFISSTKVKRHYPRRDSKQWQVWSNSDMPHSIVIHDSIKKALLTSKRYSLFAVSVNSLACVSHQVKESTYLFKEYSAMASC